MEAYSKFTAVNLPVIPPIGILSEIEHPDSGHGSPDPITNIWVDTIRAVQL